MSEDIKWKTYQLVLGIGTPKWFHMKDYYYKSKDERILVRVDPRQSTCFSQHFYAQVWVGKRKRTLLAEIKGEDECLITITTRSGLSGMTILKWYKERLNLINTNNMIRMGSVIKDKYAPTYKDSKGKGRR